MGFGLFSELPESFDETKDVAWGARAIVELSHAWKRWNERGRRPKMYNVSLLWDRQSVKGPEEARKAFCSAMNKGPIKEALAYAEKLFAGEYGSIWKEGLMSEGVHTLYCAGGLTILADPLRSGGYLYMVAFYDKPAFAAENG